MLQFVRGLLPVLIAGLRDPLLEVCRPLSGHGQLAAPFETVLKLQTKALRAKGTLDLTKDKVTGKTKVTIKSSSGQMLSDGIVKLMPLVTGNDATIEAETTVKVATVHPGQDKEVTPGKKVSDIVKAFFVHGAVQQSDALMRLSAENIVLSQLASILPPRPDRVREDDLVLSLRIVTGVESEEFHSLCSSIVAHLTSEYHLSVVVQPEKRNRDAFLFGVEL